MSDSFAHVEHYRPKSTYYWLAYSWDNLLLCCDKCNVYKANHFETDGEKAAFSEDDLTHIHDLAKRYNELESPRLVNPELEDVESRLQFTETGDVDSDDKRVKYTIETCRINRNSANEKRKTIYDDFSKKFQVKMYEYKMKKDPESIGAIKGLIVDFIEDSKNPRKEYLAFRRWIIDKTRYFQSARHKSHPRPRS